MVLFQCDNCDRQYVSVSLCPHCDCDRRKSLGRFSVADVNLLLEEHHDSKLSLGDQIQRMQQELDSLKSRDFDAKRAKQARDYDRHWNSKHPRRKKRCSA
jgi:hypothetical protein